MRPPLLSYVAWNRMGLSVENILRILESTDDFEMHIIDNNSSDDTWNFLQELQDSRIKSKLRFEVNRGPVYAFNYNLSKRKPDQYYIHLDNDVYIHTKDWISRFMEVFNTFPEVGLLGIPRSKPYPECIPPVVPRFRDGVFYLKLKNAAVNQPMDFIPGCCQMYQPELMDYIGYWSEESSFTDAEMSARVCHYTPYTAGFVTNIKIEQRQSMTCAECKARKWCTFDGSTKHCCTVWAEKYMNYKYADKFLWKNLQFFEELEQEKRSAYCASVHDPASLERIKDQVYHQDWVHENFNFYIENAN